MSSLRLLVGHSHFCKCACKLYRRAVLKLREHLLNTSQQKVMHLHTVNRKVEIPKVAKKQHHKGCQKVIPEHVPATKFDKI